jgi:hypothetical protein
MIDTTIVSSIVTIVQHDERAAVDCGDRLDADLDIQLFLLA